MPANDTVENTSHEAAPVSSAPAAPDLAAPAATPQNARTLPATFRSLRHRNYRLYFFGQLISLLGLWVQMTALMWLTHELTGQSKWVALVSAAQIVPTFLLGAWGGALADRWSK